MLETNLRFFNFITKSGNAFPCPWPHTGRHLLRTLSSVCRGKQGGVGRVLLLWAGTERTESGQTVCHQGGNTYPHLPATSSSPSPATSNNQGSQITFLALILKSPAAT